VAIIGRRYLYTMKNKLLIGLGLFLLALQTQAQTAMTKDDMFPKTGIYALKDGSPLAYDKIDSVLAAWGGKFTLTHSVDDKIILAPSDPGDEKKLLEYMSGMGAMIGQPAKDFELKDIEGKSHSLAALKGKTVVLNFWFTNCGGCVQEMPELNKLQQQYADKNVVFLALGLDDATRTRAFLKTHDFHYTLLTDAKATNADYNVTMYPISMLIDKTGIIRFVQVGGQNITESLGTAITTAAAN
jgi:peroxiredoxin